MLSIDKYAYNSRLKDIDPVQKLFFVLPTLGVCLWADNWVVSAAVLFTMWWVTAFKGGTAMGVFIKMLLIPMTFLVIGVFSIAVNMSDNPELFLISAPVTGTRLGVTYAGAVHAFELFSRALGAVSCLYCLSLTTPVPDLLEALKRLKVPSLLTEIMGLVYRFIFLLLDTADTMFTAQSSRLGYSSLFTGYRSLAVLASTLFIRAYRRSDEMYTALEARGYEGELNVLPKKYKADWTGYVWTAALNILLICLALVLR